jgi:hypothetical protein
LRQLPAERTKEAVELAERAKEVAEFVERAKEASEFPERAKEAEEAAGPMLSPAPVSGDQNFVAPRL